jgi:hypothetical protein
MASHFSGCRLIARARDLCRDRNVTIHAIPGYYDVVGVSDGTDAWVAPCSAGPFFKTSTGDVTKIMRALQAGEPLPPVPDLPNEGTTRRVLLKQEPEIPRRTLRTPLIDSQKIGRRHVQF